MAYVTDRIGTRKLHSRRYADGAVTIRALNAPYVADNMILVIASLHFTTPAAADSAIAELQVGTPLATIARARKLAGAGAVVDQIDVQLIGVVQQGEVYQITTTLVATGTCTLLHWHEMTLV